MVFYLIGLGLSEGSLSQEAVEICRKADKIYLESYTVEFPYDKNKLNEVVGKEVLPLTREEVEAELFFNEAKEKDIVLLVYGSPLMATTHSSLILKCNEEKIKLRIIHNASVFDAVAETGLQLYKFGKTASMPAWKDKYKPSSFVDIIIGNESIKAHTLILVDIGISFSDALSQLEEACKKKIKLDKILVCSRMGTEESKILYGRIDEFGKQEVKTPFCFIIPSELHFMEKESLMWFEI